MHVSRKCVQTWIDRFAAEGDAGLATRSSQPHSMPTRTSDEVEQKVLTARAERREGPDALGPKVKPHGRVTDPAAPRRAVSTECDPTTGEVIRYW